MGALSVLQQLKPERLVNLRFLVSWIVVLRLKEQLTRLFEISVRPLQNPARHFALKPVQQIHIARSRVDLL